ncbi:hypothetical protein EYF80_040491 [Liparis tanakae]|uniref:Uncharacterized protein n=1 Tax=Liparis tanakae TaxID=230148 RepID=A0A4Z2G6Z2_9TELE|nr:hypothetical protein EYF80_040491 [Liparis tanakae]
MALENCFAEEPRASAARGRPLRDRKNYCSCLLHVEVLQEGVAVPRLDGAREGGGASLLTLQTRMRADL